MTSPARHGVTDLGPVLRDWIAAVEAGLLQRATAVRLLLLAALAGEHVLLIGPPGTAKSALARRLHRVFGGTRYFERLLTRFSTPEELFGPLSLKALEDDRYERLIDGYLPTAGIAFLDEVFKANSAILNALLTLLNEREFDNGAGRRPTPLVCLVGASNETPSDDSLLAFHDRFLLRVPVAPVDDDGFDALLQLPAATPGAGAAEPPPLTAGDRARIAAAAAGVALGADALAALRTLRRHLRADGTPVSDRRWRQFVGLLRVAAASEGRTMVEAADLWLAPYVVGPDAATVARLVAWVDASLLGAGDDPLPGLCAAVEAFEQQLQIEQQAAPDADGTGTDDAGKLAVARAAGASLADGAGVRMVSARLEARQARDAHAGRRWSPVHVATRVAQVEAVRDDIDAARAVLQRRRASLAEPKRGLSWRPPAVESRWRAGLDATAGRLDALARRLAACVAGYAALPQDPALAGAAPAPIEITARPAAAATTLGA